MKGDESIVSFADGDWKQCFTRDAIMELVWVDHDREVDWCDLSELYRIAPLGKKSPEDLATVFANSRFKFFAYSSGKLVAAGRALADGLDCSYICDVVVHPDCQGQKIGKQIMGKLVNLSRGHKKIILYANPGKEDFYSKLGFRKMNTAMAIFMDQEHAIESGVVS